MKKYLIILCCTLYPLILAAEKQPLPPLHHVVGIAVPQKMNLPDSFKLDEQGHLHCQTCHAIEDIEQIPLQQIDHDDADFLRDGPYARLTDFCYQCHDRKDYQRPNIHLQIDEQGELIEHQCLFCHQQQLDTDKEYTPEQWRLRLKPQQLCVGCHLDAPHLNAREHHQQVDDELFEKILEAEHEQSLLLPLDNRHIQCITCHTPHQPGVLNPQRPAARQVSDRALDLGIGYVEDRWNEVFQKDKQQRLQQYARAHGQPAVLNYQKLQFEVLLRLPAKNGELCDVCHSFDQ